MSKGRVVMAGAASSLGSQLLRQRSDDACWIALSQRDQSIDSTVSLEWRHCDLFSLLDLEKGLHGAQYGIYMGDSMMPSARLTQGSPEDLALIAVDNFARAAAKEGLEQIIFVGSLLPCDDVELSSPMRSQIEIEKTLGSYGVPVTILRTGFTIATDNLLLQNLKRWVKNWPLLVCPPWIDSRCSPIAVEDLTDLVLHCVGNAKTYGLHYDITGDEVVSFRELLQQISHHLDLNRRIVTLPQKASWLSSFCTPWLTGVSSEQINPFVFPSTQSDQELKKAAGLSPKPLSATMETWLSRKPEDDTPLSSVTGTDNIASDVRSVQRMTLPPGKDAYFVATDYMEWLPRLLPWFLCVDIDENNVCSFRIKWLPIVLLKLAFHPERSGPDRQLFYICGGVLAVREGRGRLEFREVLEKKSVIAAIHEFRPALPWYLYRYSQAIIHLWVMHRFAAHLDALTE